MRKIWSFILHSFFLMIINIIGIIYYLYYASFLWFPSQHPEEKCLMGGPGDPIIWDFTAFPFLFGCFFINIIYLIINIIKCIRHKKFYFFIIIIAIVFVLWKMAFNIDDAHQYDGSCVYDDKAETGNKVK